MTYAVLVASVALFSLVVCALPWLGTFRRLRAANYRGRELPKTLGFGLVVPAVVLMLRLGKGLVGGEYLLAGLAIVFATGLIDDFAAGEPRGLRGHLREIVRLRPTTGLLKVAGGLAGGLLVALSIPGRSPAAMALGLVTVAGSTNVWNGLDVAPGRAGKAFLVTAAVLLLAASRDASWLLLLMVFAAALPALWLDIREHYMLGDAGSTVLGFAIGAGLYGALPDVWLGVSAVLVVALTLVAETVTFSRIIDAVPPLRWFDRLGTLPERRNFPAN